MRIFRYFKILVNISLIVALSSCFIFPGKLRKSSKHGVFNYNTEQPINNAFIKIDTYDRNCWRLSEEKELMQKGIRSEKLKSSKSGIFNSSVSWGIRYQCLLPDAGSCLRNCFIILKKGYYYFDSCPERNILLKNNSEKSQSERKIHYNKALKISEKTGIKPLQIFFLYPKL